MLPRVVLHNAVSLDGRIDWFTPDVGLFYELASHWDEDATLAGSNTILKPGESIPDETEQDLQPPVALPDDTRPLLVVPDTRGRVRNWHVLRKAPYWRGMVALCCHSTPREYLDYLRARHVDHIVKGDEHVALREALEELNVRYGVKLIRVDSGGTLNGALLRAGLVDEVSVLIHPCLVGGISRQSFFRAPDLTSPRGVIQIRLTHLEKLKDDIVWLRYEVTR